MGTSLRLLKLEYTKFKDHSLIVILLLLYVIISCLGIMIGKSINSLPQGAPKIESIFQFPLTWDFFGWIGSHTSFFFLGLAAVFMVVNEVTYKTFRQNIISGLTRREYFQAKVLSIIVISLGAALLYGMTASIYGIIHTRSWEFVDITDNSWAISRYFLMCMGYMSLGLLCGLAIRRSGLAILFYLFYGYALEVGMKWLLIGKLDFIGKEANFLPINAMEDLHPFPLYRLTDFIPDMDISFPFLLTYTEASIASALWIMAILALAYRMFSRGSL